MMKNTNETIIEFAGSMPLHLTHLAVDFVGMLSLDEKQGTKCA